MQVEQAALISNMMYFDDFVFDPEKTIGKNLLYIQKNQPKEWNTFTNSIMNSIVNG